MTSKGDELRKECCSFATAIIDSWQPAHRGYGWEKRNTDRDAFPASLCALLDALPSKPRGHPRTSLTFAEQRMYCGTK
jgi:hypothetical protein